MASTFNNIAIDNATDDKKKITWDEECIKEHDKERGTRMKIVEPNTPYVYYDEDSDKAKSATGEYAGAPKHTKPGELDFTELSDKLNKLKRNNEKNKVLESGRKKWRGGDYIVLHDFSRQIDW